MNSWISLLFLYSVDRTLLLGKIRRDTINQLLIYGAPKHFWSGAYLCHFSNRRWNLHGKWVDGFKLDLTVEKAPSNLEVANGTSLISWSNNCQLQSFDNNIILGIKGQQNAQTQYFLTHFLTRGGLKISPFRKPLLRQTFIEYYLKFIRVKW